MDKVPGRAQHVRAQYRTTREFAFDRFVIQTCALRNRPLGTVEVLGLDCAEGANKLARRLEAWANEKGSSQSFGCYVHVLNREVNREE